MGKKIRLSILTPASQFYDEDVDYVLLRATEGEIVIMPGHTALTCALDYGIMKIVVDGKELKATLMGGFVEVSPNKITLLSDAAEWPENIDVARAKASEERAMRRIATGGKEIDADRVDRAVRRAKLRIQASSHKNK